MAAFRALPVPVIGRLDDVRVARSAPADDEAYSLNNCLHSGELHDYRYSRAHRPRQNRY